MTTLIITAPTLQAAQFQAQADYPLSAYSQVLTELDIKAVKQLIADTKIKLNQLVNHHLVLTSITPVAQHALLKLLEEPPHNQRFILIKADHLQLLPTIESRAQIIRVASPSSPTDLNLNQLSYNDIFKLTEKIDKPQAVAILEQLLSDQSIVNDLKKMELLSRAGERLNSNQLPGTVIEHLLINLSSRA